MPNSLGIMFGMRDLDSLWLTETELLLSPVSDCMQQRVELSANFLVTPMPMISLL